MDKSRRFLPLDISNITLYTRNLTHKWILSNIFPKKITAAFWFLEKARETYPTIPPLVARLKVKEDTREQQGSEPDPQKVYKWFAVKGKKSYRVASGQGF